MIDQLYSLFQQSTGICTDTRTLENGQLFFALKGDNFNGNKYASVALDQGAIAAVVDEKGESDDHRYILVDDALKALQELAHHHRMQLIHTRFIGLTGSNGKTTAKELMKSVCSQRYVVAATKGNLNNHIGVPLTLLSITSDVEIAIIEMGANHQGEIYKLAGIAQPNIVYITNFGKAHLEGFGGVEGVIKGKSELYQRAAQFNSTALVNGYDPIQMEKTSSIKRVVFGPEVADYPMEFLSLNHPASVSMNGMEITSNLTGHFHTANIGAAISLGLHVGLTLEEIQRGLLDYTPSNNRSEWRKTDLNTIFLDAYNANPSSMSASIEAFRNEVSEPAWYILGDMFELGEYSTQEHQVILDQVKGYSHVITVGMEFGKAKSADSHQHFDTTEECLEHLTTHPISGAHILLKGSRGMHLESLLKVL